MYGRAHNYPIRPSEDDYYEGNRCKRKDVCAHSVRMFTGEGEESFACFYMARTGEPRGCPAESCDKFVPDLGKKLQRKRNRLNGLFHK